MLTREYTYAYGAVDVCTGELASLTLPDVNTECMQLFLNDVSARNPQERIVMVIDGAGCTLAIRSKRRPISICSNYPRLRQSSTRLSTSGMSCVRSSLATVFSRGLMLWKLLIRPGEVFIFRSG